MPPTTRQLGSHKQRRTKETRVAMLIGPMRAMNLQILVPIFLAIGKQEG